MNVATFFSKIIFDWCTSGCCPFLLYMYSITKYVNRSMVCRCNVACKTIFSYKEMQSVFKKYYHRMYFCNGKFPATGKTPVLIIIQKNMYSLEVYNNNTVLVGFVPSKQENIIGHLLFWVYTVLMHQLTELMNYLLCRSVVFCVQLSWINWA